MSRYYTFSELKESKIIYDRKPPAFGVIITFMTLIFIVAAILWAGFSTRTYVVKANGLVASQSKVNVMNKVSASIDEIFVKEGDTVKKGDVLVQLNSFQVELQIAQIQANVDFFGTKVEVLERLIAFVNNFTLNDADSRINPFDNTKVDEMSAFSNAQTFIDYVKGQEDAKAAEDPPAEYTQTEADGLKQQFLSQQYTSLDEVKGQMIQYQSQLAMYQNSLSEYQIVAEQDGVIHLSAGLTVGTVIQAGTLLGSISSPKNDTFVLESIVSATDRSKIAVGNKVEIALAGVVQSEFGVLTGEIVSIDVDAAQTENGEVFYRVVIKPDKTHLESPKGNKVNLTVGMIAESRIKYDETTWLKWAIEQIGVKFK